jgi:hypothetical protein
MKTVSLADGKYEFDMKDGQMVAARRHGVPWPADFDDRFNHCFVEALNRIIELEEASKPKTCMNCRGVLPEAHKDGFCPAREDSGY